MSRSGHADQFYAVAQWFPKVAVYDAEGWHEMPYLSAGEYYSNFGRYDVKITLPANYVVGATGNLQSEEEKKWMRGRTTAFVPEVKRKPNESIFEKRKPGDAMPPSDTRLKTLHYVANEVIDFAWSADKRFLVKYDTCQLGNGMKEIWNLILPSDEKQWESSLVFTKKALRFYSAMLGPYPYDQATVVASPASEADGMEYPMFTLLNVKPPAPDWLLDQVIAHEIGHNWFQATLATNERAHAWMDEGMNTYLELKYMSFHYPEKSNKQGLQSVVSDAGPAALQLLISNRSDAPLESTPDKFMPLHHYLIAYYKGAQWMQQLENRIGESKMHELLSAFYKEWQFKHPQPNDFTRLAASFSPKPLTNWENKLSTTGMLEAPTKSNTRLRFLAGYSPTASTRYIGIAPAFGQNNYDKFQVGALVHNYNVPASSFQFVATPMYATGSKSITGYGRVGYHWYGEGKVKRTEVFVGAARFSNNNNVDKDGKKIFTAFTKITPGVLWELRKQSPISTLERYVDFRTFIIQEQQLRIVTAAPPGDTVSFAERSGSVNSLIPQLTFTWNNTRKLYPWRLDIGLQQVKDIMRINFTGRYFLNYDASGKGLSARLFVGKIFYMTERTDEVRSNNSRYHFTLHAPNGEQDYTYSNPFAERNQSAELAGRQIAMRDGGFKYRSDFSSVVPGLKTSGSDYFDNWLAALNLNVDIPDKLNPLSLLPFSAPLKIFADVGTSASPWQPNATHPRFLYSIGIHLPIAKVLHVYYPIIQSSAFKEPNSVNDPFNADGPNWWQKYLTFSLEIQALVPRPLGLRLF
jgi:hypothetical protein